MEKLSNLRTAVRPTPADLERLAAEYDEHCNSNDGYEVAQAGGDDPIELQLAPGDTYSTVEYDPSSKHYYWRHDNVVIADDEETENENMGLVWDHWTDKY